MQNLPVIPAAAPAQDLAADTAIMLALMLTRPATIFGKVLGLVGFDRAAQALAGRAARGFGMRVLVQAPPAGIDRAAMARLGAGISPSLDHLLAEADVVSLHGSPGDGVIVDAAGLNRMKPDACLINTAHGALMDQQALLHALWFETIGGAGIAVAGDSLDHLADFRACENAIVLPGPASRAAALVEPIPAARRGANVVPLFPGGHHGG